MLNHLQNQKQNIVLVGDVHVSQDVMEEALRASTVCCGRVDKVFWGDHDKEAFSISQLQIERNGPEAVPYAPELDAFIEEADVLITHFCPIPAKLIRKGKRLKAIFTSRGGTEHIDVQAASAANIPVVNVVRNAVPVAEFTLGMILSVTRNIAASHAAISRKNWKRNFPNSERLTCLQNMTVGLAGLGNVGIELARRLRALEVPVIAHDPWADAARLQRNGLGDIEILDSLDALFTHSDVLSLHLRLTPDTQGMIDAKYFSLMKPSAYFINSSRGGLIIQNDLVNALQNGHIAGAALDVFDQEPLDPDSPLISMENVTLTPHIAGETREALSHSPWMLMREVDNILLRNFTERIVNERDLHSIA